MPEPRFYTISEENFPEFARLKVKVKYYARSCIDKVIANSINPEKFPLVEGSLEDDLRGRFQKITDLDPTLNLTRGERMNRRRIKGLAQAKWNDRFTSNGNIRRSRSTINYLNPLEREVSISTNRTVAQQLPSDYFFNDSIELIEKLKHLRVPEIQASAESVEAYRWIKEKFDIEESAVDSSPQVTKLELMIEEVHCVNETDPEGGWDQIRLGGQTIDHTGKVRKIEDFYVKTFRRSGRSKTFDPLHQFAEFNLNESGGWPRTYFATFALCEKDNGGFDGFLNDLVAKTFEIVATQAAAAGVGELVGAVLSGVIASAVAAVVAIIVALIIAAIIEEIIEAWEDDFFAPITVSLPLNSHGHANGIDYVEEGAWANVNFIGHGGHYRLKYTWRCK